MTNLMKWLAGRSEARAEVQRQLEQTRQARISARHRLDEIERGLAEQRVLLAELRALQAQLAGSSSTE